ncbi:2-hydroxychromene-2-carboxylate isomerase [Thalassomonas actiniarum]|uniref:2-hydroxychromene-2-carboxylate isomerase n=1 Tax=Thalassomonas actiniarum TaxID=485447 RepID=A0AAE9YX08_9GAMM|nr:2-hydroxychromene-2-carboxylate isomerase [Thalassomonas actiniarum]WDE02680.1 2-hydroxychromene-2-carboxylate isomerase [Thalassomonas actiniarum]
MNTEIDFYFDFGSPTSYLAYYRLQQLSRQHALHIHYKPVLLGGIFKQTDNASPAMIPAKARYMMQHDLPRFAKRYDVDFKLNPYFPINTLPLMRGALAAEKSGCFDRYCQVVFTAIWQKGLNLGDMDILARELAAGDIDVNTLMALSQGNEIKQALIRFTDEAVARGLFGVPTMFIGNDMYFGQDRLDFIEETLTTR